MHQEVKTVSEFDEAIKNGKVLVDFWATWCGPCMMMGQKIADEIEPNFKDIKIVKINVDEADPAIAARFGIMSIPALFCFVDGVKKAEFIGVTDTQKLVSALSPSI